MLVLDIKMSRVPPGAIFCKNPPLFLPLDQLPRRHPFATPRRPALAQAIFVQAQPAPAALADGADGEDRNGLAGGAQVLRRHVGPPAEAVVVEGDVVVLAPVDAVDAEEEDVRHAGPVPDRVPVGADALELEAHRRRAVRRRRDGDFPARGHELGVAQPFGSRHVVDLTFFRAAVGGDVRLPRQAAAVVAEELGFIGWEMPEAEVVVRHGKVARGEIFVVGLSGALDVASTPAAVDQFPFAVVDLDRVPRVV